MSACAAKQTYSNTDYSSKYRSKIDHGSGALKRKRSESRTSIFTNILESAQNLESLCREQEEDINKLKAQVSNRALTVRESDKLKRKVQTWEQVARDWEGQAKRLERENEALTKKCDAEVTRRRRLQDEVQSLQQERDSVKQTCNFEIVRKQAVKEMLMVNNSFKAESIEIAAKAISEGKRARDAVADIYRSDDGVALN
jgi:chromosome segregation ATPase